jgi:uncharacterized protein YcbK (DUF882 family)
VTTQWTRRSFLTACLGAAPAVLARPASTHAAATRAQAARLSLYNIHTREAATIVYRDAAGGYDSAALHRLHHVLRCHFTDEVAPIDIRVIEFLGAVDHALHGDREIHVISGFRSAAYNDWLRRHTSGVAARSLHLEGRAIDVRFPGVPLREVRRVALAVGGGGVGYYPTSDFVHLDSGRVRSW